MKISFKLKDKVFMVWFDFYLLRRKNNLQSLLLPIHVIIENPQPKYENIKRGFFIDLAIHGA